MKTRGGMANGVFGCAVVGIILLASLGMAFLGNVDERQVDTTNWDYVTSANPAFSYNQAPARVDYSPPANYTGFYAQAHDPEYTSGITYTPSSTPTAYPIKKEPVTVMYNTTSYNWLNNNGLTYFGNQNTDWSLNNVVIRSIDPLTWYSPASLSFLSGITTAIESVHGSALPNHSIIELISTSDNLYFIYNSENGDHWAGVTGAQYPRYATFAGPPADKVVIDNDTRTATLYDGNAAIQTAPLEDILIGVAGFSGSPSADDLKALRVDYNVKYWTREYLNPIYGVQVDVSPAYTNVLSDMDNYQSQTVYTGVNLSGQDIIEHYGAGHHVVFDFWLRLGGTVDISEYQTTGSAWINSVDNFNWTPTETGVYTFNITKNVPGKWEWSTTLKIRVTNTGYVSWDNGYRNAAIDIMINSFEGTINAGPTIVSCASSAWEVGGVSVGTWPAIVLSLDTDAGISVKPVSSFVNFNDYVLADTSVLISDTPLTEMISEYYRLPFGTADEVTLSIISTTIYVEGGGVYRVDSTLDVNEKFPNYNMYNVTIAGAPHWGDSITINGTECAADKDAGTVTINNMAFPLAGLVLAYSDSEFYYNGTEYPGGHVIAINGDLAADLGAASGLVLEFDGIWYYETNLYEGAPGVTSVYDWAPGTLGMDAATFSAVFTLLSLVGLAVSSRLGGGLWDYLVIGSAVVVGFVMCGVTI